MKLKQIYQIVLDGWQLLKQHWNSPPSVSQYNKWLDEDLPNLHSSNKIAYHILNGFILAIQERETQLWHQKSQGD